MIVKTERNWLREQSLATFLVLAVCFIILFSTNVSAFDWSYTVAYYQFEENSGTLKDSHINNYNSINETNITYSQTGIINKAIGFENASLSNIILPTNIRNNGATTFSFWIKTKDNISIANVYFDGGANFGKRITFCKKHFLPLAHHS